MGVEAENDCIRRQLVTQDPSPFTGAMKAKLLIVDDDTDIVTVLEDRLQASGYTTVIARDGQQALDQIEQESPNLILLDLDLPKLTGIQVLKRLAQIKHVEDLPVIVMTAHGSVNAAVEAMKEGAYDFLTKPLDKDHLLIVIRKALERDSLKRQVAYLRSEVDGRYALLIRQEPTPGAALHCGGAPSVIRYREKASHHANRPGVRRVGCGGHPAGSTLNAA